MRSHDGLRVIGGLNVHFDLAGIRMVSTTCPAHFRRKKVEPEPSLRQGARPTLVVQALLDHRSLTPRASVQGPMVLSTEGVCAVVVNGPESPLPPCRSLISGMMGGMICRV